MSHNFDTTSATMTPREIVQELDRHIVGQQSAKRAVAIALRNRWRRMQLAPELRNEVMPKNILMIGPTGVGKTEIARRLATLANAPFVKVEATRFTEVGYVGKDVEQIVRDLADTAVKMYREQAKVKVRLQAEERAEERILDALRDIPDFPEPGVTFKDITPLLADAVLFADVVAEHARPWAGRVDAVAGLEARGFIFGAAVAVHLGVGFVPVRKAGKLPADAVGVDYALEYGTARIEAHADAVPAGARVLVVDDVLATGGTAAAACRLFEQLQAEVVGVDVVIELAALGGRERLPERAVRALLTV